MRLALAAGLMASVLSAEGERWPAKPMSELELGIACHEHPDSLGEWFPIHHLKMPMPRPAADDIERVEANLSRERCYAGGVLRSYQEPVLAHGSTTGETYRLIWSPSFESTVVIRVQEWKGRVLSTVKRDVSMGSNLTGEFLTEVSEVTATDFMAIKSAADHAACWTSDHTCHAEKSVDPMEAAGWVVHTDGESWLLEGARGMEHWGVTVDDPVGGPFLEVCAAVIRAARAQGRVKLTRRTTSTSKP